MRDRCATLAPCQQRRAHSFATLTALAAVALASPPAQGQQASQAHASRALNVTDTAHLERKNQGSLILEEGHATGALPGGVKVNFELGPTIKAYFTITNHYGSLSGRGAATLHSSGLYASFGGSMTVTHGTGRYRNAHGHGGFYGVINRHTYALTVQTTGSLSY